MSSAEWAALADRFEAIAADGEFLLQTFDGSDWEAHRQVDYPLVYPFDYPSPGGQPPATWAGPAGRPGDLSLTEFARLNRLCGLSFAAGLLLGRDGLYPPEVGWWRRVWAEHRSSARAGDAPGRRVLKNLAGRSAGLARRLAADPPTGLAGWLPMTPGRWPDVQRAIEPLLPRLRDRRWEGSEVHLALVASADPNAYSAWCLADGRTPPGSVPGLPGPWDGVWGDPAAVAAFTRIARDATPFVPVGLRLAQPLYPGRRADENADGGTVRHFVTAVLLTVPEAFVLSSGRPPAAAPAAVLRGSPFDAAAAAIDRITRSPHRDAVASVHRNAVLLNPWLAPADRAAAAQAVAACHARDGGVTSMGGLPDEPPRDTVPSAGAEKSDRDPAQPSKNRQADILSALRSAGTPLQREEIVVAMRLKSEGKLGAHLAWMVRRGILTNQPQKGYWPAGTPEPE